MNPIDRAKELRAQGLSTRQIADDLGNIVHFNTIRRWVKGIEVPKVQRELVEKSCDNCSNSFEPKDKRQRFCSQSCAATFNQRGKPSKNKRNPLNYCPKCDRPKSKKVEVCLKCKPKVSGRDRKDYNAYMRKYIFNRYHIRMEQARKKLGGKCVKCGVTEDLDLDHIDRNTKDFTVGHMWSVSDQRFLQELSKCQLLCKKHHKEKTQGELRKSVCKRGHLRIPENLYPGTRSCKLCARELKRERYAKLKNV